MRTMLSLLITTALTAASALDSITAVTPPELAWAQISLPYAELQSLWATIESQTELQDQKPPVDAVLLAAKYDLTLKEDRAVLHADYRIQSLTDQWHLVPLLGGEARLEQVETGNLSVLWQNNTYCLLTKGTGNVEISLEFAVPPPDQWIGNHGLRLNPGIASLNQLRISGLPTGKTVRVAGLDPAVVEEDSVNYRLPSDSGELTLWLDRYEPFSPPLASPWDIQSEVFVHYHEGKLVYECQIYAQADQGSGLSLDLLLPRKASSVNFTAEDLAHGRLQERRNGSRPLHLEFRTRDLLDRKLELTYQLSQSPLSTNWVLQPPRISGDGSIRSLLAIPIIDGLELAGDDLKGSTQSQGLPKWLRQRVGAGDFVTAETDRDYHLQATWLPRLQTAQAMITQAKCSTRLVTDGALLVQAEYTIQHQSPLSWRLQLPVVDEILACEINQHPAQPVKRSDNEIEFSLATPAGDATRVAFCYAARTATLDPVSGRIDLEMPRTDLFIHSLQWQLTIPQIYETTAIEGNMAINSLPDASSAPLTGNVIPLKKELIRGEAPAVEVYYQRRGLNE